MNAVQLAAEAAVESTPVVRADASAVMDIISRAASDPAMDVERLERLMNLYERIHDRDAKAAYTAALAAMQPRLPVISEKGKISIPGKEGKKGQETPYALWEDINDAIRPLLAEYGFCLSFRTGLHEDGRIKVVGVLGHREGHQEETTMILPHDSTGSKNAVQAIGSSTSYGKRYTAMALLNITSRGEDDNGKAGGANTITSEQVGELQALMEDVGADREKFLAFMKAESISDIPAGAFKKAVDSLNAKRGR